MTRVLFAWVVAIVLAGPTMGRAGEALRVDPVVPVLTPGADELAFWTVAGEPALLTFVARGGTPPYRASWSFGDQSRPQVVDCPNGRLCSATHTYTLGEGVYQDYRVLEITITDSTGAKAHRAFPVRVEGRPDDALRRYLAVHKALWNLHTRLDAKDGKVTSPAVDGAASLAAAALHLQLLANTGHNPFDTSTDDPYADDARALVAAVTSRLVPTTLDGNANLLGLRGDFYLYEYPMVLMALASVYKPGATVMIGTTAVPLEDVCQGMAEYLCHAQAVGGGWRYSAKSPAADFSITQWPAIALEAYEQTFAPLKKIPNATAAKLAGVRASLEKLVRAQIGNGGIGYMANTAPTPAMNGAAICCTCYAGVKYTDPLVIRLRAALLDQWDTVRTEIQGGEAYTLYGVMKGLRNYESRPDTPNGAIESGRLREANRYRDWYDEFSRGLVAAQSAQGTWIYRGKDLRWQGIWATDPDGRVQTAMAALCLQPRVFEPGPVPVIATVPPVDLPLDPIFDHSESLSGDRQAGIADYTWDFDGDGKTDFRTADPTERPRHRYGKPGKYMVTLTVTVRVNGRDRTASVSREVQVADRSDSPGRIVPPPGFRTGPLFAGVRNQVLLVPIGAEPIGEGWKSFEVRIGNRPSFALDQRARFAAVLPTDDGIGELPAQIAGLSTTKSAASAFRIPVRPAPADLETDARHRPVVVVGGLPPNKLIQGVLCAVFADGTRWDSHVELRPLDSAHYGLPDQEFTRESASLRGVGLILFNLPQDPAPRIWSPHHIPIWTVPGRWTEAAHTLNARLRLAELEK